MIGYIKLWRKILGWELFKDANAFRLFIYLLLSVNIETTHIKGAEIQAGECVFSLGIAAQALGLTERQIRIALDKLIECECVTKSKLGRALVVRVNSFDLYQNRSEEVMFSSRLSQHEKKERRREEDIKYKNNLNIILRAECLHESAIKEARDSYRQEIVNYDDYDN